MVGFMRPAPFSHRLSFVRVGREGQDCAVVIAWPDVEGWRWEALQQVFTNGLRGQFLIVLDRIAAA